MGLGSEIRDPEKNLFRILGSKRHRIPDPHHVDADPDPYFYVYPDPQSLQNIFLPFRFKKK
jgi:hypothetical protein